MWYYNGKIIKTPKTMIIDGKTYPREIFKDSSTLSSLGIKPYRQVSSDTRYFKEGVLEIVDSGDEVVGTWSEDAKDINGLKAKMLTSIKNQLSGLLSNTDWYYLRKLRTGTDVPSDIQDYSDALYSEYDTKKTEINAMTKMSHIMEYENRLHTEVRKVESTNSEGETIYGPKTTSAAREINMCMHWTASPNDKVDPAFVSLTAD